MIVIPTLQQASADFQMRIELGGQLVGLRFTWNDREATFYVTLTDPLGAQLTGVKVIPFWPLLKQYKGQIQFVGDLMVLKTSKDTKGHITYDNFGRGWDLMYVSAAELKTWEDSHGI